MEEVTAKLEAAGILTEVVGLHGIARVEMLWKSEGWSDLEHAAGKSVETMEAEYRTMAHYAGAVQRVDIDRLREGGCTPN